MLWQFSILAKPNLKWLNALYAWFITQSRILFRALFFSTQMHCGIQLITHKQGNESFRVCFFLFVSLFRSLSLYFWILLYHIKSISFGIFSKKISVSTDSKTRLRKQECVTHRRFAITMNLQWHYKIETDSAAFKRLSGTPFVMVSSMAFFYVAIVVAFAQWFSPIHIFSIFFFNSKDIITGFALGQMLMLSIWKVRPQYLNHRWLCRDSQRQWQI